MGARRIADRDHRRQTSVAGRLRYSGELRWCRGKQRFRTSFSTHRELVLADEQILRDLVAVVIARMPANEFTLSRDDLLKYADAQLTNGDPEWTKACGTGLPASEWPALIARMKARNEKATKAKAGGL